MAMLSLCCGAWAFSGCGEQGRFSTCGAWASHCGGLLQSMGSRMRLSSCAAWV